MIGKKNLSYSRRGIFSLFNVGIATFFTIGVIVSIILIYAGFTVTDTQKEVVNEVVSKVDDHLTIGGETSAFADISSNELKVTGTPIRTSSAGAVNVDPQVVDISYQLIQSQNNTITYDDIYVGMLTNNSFNSLEAAVSAAKLNGLIEINPFESQQKPTSTHAFIYWRINQNYDNFVDSNELATIAIVYADKDRPSSGEYIVVQVNVPDGYILKLERNIPNISSTIMSFGGKISE